MLRDCKLAGTRAPETVPRQFHQHLRSRYRQESCVSCTATVTCLIIQCRFRLHSTHVFCSQHQFASPPHWCPRSTLASITEHTLDMPQSFPHFLPHAEVHGCPMWSVARRPPTTQGSLTQLTPPQASCLSNSQNHGLPSQESPLPQNHIILPHPHVAMRGAGPLGPTPAAPSGIPRSSGRSRS